MYKKTFYCILALFNVYYGCAQNKPKNIIFLIGDGMGLSQLSYGVLTQTKTSNFERLPVVGLSKTESSSSKITDSAAGATAFAIGEKTYNGAIGVDSLKKTKQTILELAEQKGLATGMITTCAITHATPAAFIAHQPYRRMYEEIAMDFLKTDIDVFIGGGFNHFSKRKDSLNLTSTLTKKGYKIYTNEYDLFHDDTPTTKIAALVAAEHLPKMQDGRGDYESKAFAKALEVLTPNKQGFFLMIEGSQIDWGGHENDATYVQQEVWDFDQVLGKVIDFAEKDGNTLVVVTADHETGGLALTPKTGYKGEEYGEIAPSFTSKGHSATMVPVFAYGPSAEQFMGIYDNTAIFWKMKNLLGL